MNTKTNDILNDIIHLASQAIITDDEVVKNQALGDIHAEIASILPVDHGVYRTPPHVVDFIANLTNVPFVGEFHPDYLKKIAEKYKLVPVDAAAEGRVSTVTGEDGRARTPDAPSGFSKYLTVADGVKLARFSNEHWVKLIAKRQAKQGNTAVVFEIYVDKEENFAQVFRDDTIMFKVEGHSVGHSFVESLAISCLKRYLKDNRMTMEKNKRKRARKAAEKAEAERAARSAAPTVAVSVGCPSLVPPCRIPAGFDGVEPTQEDLENA